MSDSDAATCGLRNWALTLISYGLRLSLMLLKFLSYCLAGAILSPLLSSVSNSVSFMSESNVKFVTCEKKCPGLILSVLDVGEKAVMSGYGVGVSFSPIGLQHGVT